ncbi:hypothetical protein cand_029470 [Cryptosporidium andersoni]|uniref:Uncharacterized protein n=1 Tax=Cryptosporidium andersoni TaxID=117008 RepID=A0A1J4MND1_9CRYT|nr:hypothetical protein cand_029470 [Cryptosporidium andersoni]
MRKYKIYVFSFIVYIGFMLGKVYTLKGKIWSPLFAREMVINALDYNTSTEPRKFSHITTNYLDNFNKSFRDIGAEIIPSQISAMGNSCNNSQPPVHCSGNETSFFSILPSYTTTTITGFLSEDFISFNFTKNKSDPLISLLLDTRGQTASARLYSVVNDTIVSSNLTVIDFYSHIPLPLSLISDKSLDKKLIFVMIYTNTSLTFVINNVVLATININIAEVPLPVSHLNVNGLTETNIYVEPFISNLRSNWCSIDGTNLSNIAVGYITVPYAVACTSRNILIPRSIDSSSQLVLTIPGINSLKSLKIMDEVVVDLHAESGIKLFTLIANDNGVYLRGYTGNQLQQTKGGYNPFHNFGFQPVSLRFIFSSLFIILLINELPLFEPINIPDNQIPSLFSIEGLISDAIVTLLPSKYCTITNRLQSEVCVADGSLPNSPNLGGRTRNYYGHLFAASKIYDSTELPTINFTLGNSPKEAFNYFVDLNSSIIGLYQNNETTSLDAPFPLNKLSTNEPIILEFGKLGMLIQSKINSHNIADFFNLYAWEEHPQDIYITGSNIQLFSTAFVPAIMNCYLLEHKGSYLTSICIGDELCFATGSSGGPSGASYYFIGKPKHDKIEISLQMIEISLGIVIEYNSGHMNILRKSSSNFSTIYSNKIERNGYIYNNPVIGIMDTGQFLIVTIQNNEVVKLSKGGLGVKGNISCVKMTLVEEGFKAIYFVAN